MYYATSVVGGGGGGGGEGHIGYVHACTSSCGQIDYSYCAGCQVTHMQYGR